MLCQTEVFEPKVGRASSSGVILRNPLEFRPTERQHRSRSYWMRVGPKRNVISAWTTRLLLLTCDGGFSTGGVQTFPHRPVVRPSLHSPRAPRKSLNLRDDGFRSSVRTASVMNNPRCNWPSPWGRALVKPLGPALFTPARPTSTSAGDRLHVDGR